MSAEWVNLLQSIIFTRIKKDFSEKLKTKYKMANNNFSTVGRSDTPAVFPFVYVEELESQEVGSDLEGATTNGLRYGIRIHISDNKSQSNAKEIAHEVRRIMKSMRFSCGMPISQNTTNNVHTYVLQCSRIIGSGDIL